MGHPLTWIQRKSHRFGQGAHVDGGKSEQDPAELVLTFKTWALYSVRCPCPKSGLLPILGRTLHRVIVIVAFPVIVALPFFLDGHRTWYDKCMGTQNRRILFLDGHRTQY